MTRSDGRRRKVVVLFSGGQDSTTCLYLAIRKYGVKNVVALTISYGQRHATEVQAARIIAEMAGVEWRTMTVTAMAGGTLLDHNSALHKTYTEDRYRRFFKEYPSSFVPGRNVMFGTLAASMACSLLEPGSTDIPVVMMGVSAADNAGYPDCTKQTVRSLEKTLCLALGGLPLEVETPLVSKTKAETVELAMGLPGCMEALKYSLTCYAGLPGGCGRCDSCTIRAEGFKTAGVADPAVEYATSQQ